MDNQSPPLHPLVKVAAGSVIVASAVGVAAMTGLFSKAANEPATATPPAVTAPAEASAAPIAAPAPVAAAPTPAPAPAVAAEEPRPKHHHHVVHEARNEYDQGNGYGPAPAAAACYDCGTVVSINTVVDQGKGTGLGAVGGAVAGGVLGHQMGGGRGKDAMTVVGALAGAFAGNEAEKSIRKTQHYEVSVQMEDGSSRSFRYNSVPPFSSGDRVKVSGEQLIPR